MRCRLLFTLCTGMTVTAIHRIETTPYLHVMLYALTTIHYYPTGKHCYTVILLMLYIYIILYVNNSD